MKYSMTGQDKGDMYSQVSNMTDEVLICNYFYLPSNLYLTVTFVTKEKWQVKICVLLLMEGNYLEKMENVL